MSYFSNCRCALLIAIALVCLCEVKPAAAQTRSWTGTVNSGWHGVFNWSPVGAPLPTDSAFIGDLPGQENATVNLTITDAEVTNLTLQESTELHQSDVALTVSDTMTLFDSSEYSIASDNLIPSAASSLLVGDLTLDDSSVFRIRTLGDVEVEGALTIGSNATLFHLGGEIMLSNVADLSGAVLVNNGLILGGDGGSGTETLTIQADSAGTIDLDGTTGSGQVELLFTTMPMSPNPSSSALRILSPLTDAFSGTMRIGDFSELEITNAWAADEFAQIELLGGQISGGPFTSAASITVLGPSVLPTIFHSNTVFNGGNVDVEIDAELVFDTVSFGGTTAFHSDGHVFFNGSTILNGVNLTGAGDLSVHGTMAIQGSVSLTGTTLDWDGGDPPGFPPVGRFTTINSGASLSLDFNTLDVADDVFDALLTMNGGTLSVNVNSDEWTHAGMANLSGNNTIAGDRMVVDGDFNVASGAQNIQAQVDFGGAADVDIFGAATSVTTHASTRFQTGTQVTVGAGSTLNLNGPITLDGPALVDGAGTIVQNGSSVVLSSTTIDVASFDWDGATESSTTNISDATAFTINSAQIDADNHFDGNLLIGQQSAAFVNTASPWHMEGYVRLDDFSGLAGTAPVVIAGQIDVEGPGTFISTDANFVAGASVELAQDAEFGLYSSTNSIAGAEISGPGTLSFWGATTINTGSTIDVAEIDIRNDPITMTGGQVTTTNFTKDAAATFSLQGGNFKISGGDAAFNSTFIFGGTGNPIARIDDGADAVVTFAWRMAPGAADSGTTVVTGTGGGRRSTLRGTGGGAGADLVVGLSGSSALLVSQGGLASFRDDFIIAQNAGSVGQATVTGVQDGFRATVDVTGSAGNSSVQIGGGDGGGAAAGILRIQGGALVQTSGDLIMARYPGIDSIAHLEIGGMAGGFPAELNVADDIFVGGTATTAGGEATITFDSGGLLRADEMIVWSNSTVDMNGGEMFLNTLDLTSGGDFNLAGGVLHVGLVEGSLTNTGGTISPGGSPGTTTITEDYKQDPGAGLLIELAGLLPGTQYDQFSVANDMLLNGGNLDVVLDGGFIPHDGDVFDVLDFANIMGTFDLVTLPALPSPLAWDTSQLYSTGALSVIAALTADFDNDGDVDGDDLRVWQKFYSVTDDADADGDGDSDGRDFLEWQRQYTGPGKIAATLAVPEPAALWSVMLATAVLCLRRRT